MGWTFRGVFTCNIEGCEATEQVTYAANDKEEEYRVPIDWCIGRVSLNEDPDKIYEFTLCSIHRLEFLNRFKTDSIIIGEREDKLGS